MIGKVLRKRDYLNLDERDLDDLLGSYALLARKSDECKICLLTSPTSDFLACGSSAKNPLNPFNQPAPACRGR